MPVGTDKAPAQWTVEEVLPEDAVVEGSCGDAATRLLRIVQSGPYNAAPVPEVGQVLVVKEPEQ